MSAYRASTDPRPSHTWTGSPFAGLVPQESGERFTRRAPGRCWMTRPDVKVARPAVRKVEPEMMPERDGW